VVAEKRAKLAAIRERVAALQKQLSETQAEHASLTFQVIIIGWAAVRPPLNQSACATNLQQPHLPTNNRTWTQFHQADLSQRRLGRAGKLTSLLGNEMARWQTTADGLGARIDLLPGDALLAAACVSYAGPFTGVL
jgi:hypothetical protein